MLKEIWLAGRFPANYFEAPGKVLVLDIDYWNRPIVIGLKAPRLNDLVGHLFDLFLVNSR